MATEKTQKCQLIESQDKYFNAKTKQFIKMINDDNEFS